MIESIIIFCLILLNGLFAMTEIALVSSKKVRLEDMAKRGSLGAQKALKLLSEPEKFLSTVQVGITFIGVISGAFGGLALAENVQPILLNMGLPIEYAYEFSLVIIITVITFLSLVGGELVPKTIALNNPEAISARLSGLMQVVSYIGTPLVSLLSFSTKIVLKVFRIKQPDKPPVTEEELKLMIEQGGRHGVLEIKETEMMKGIFRFGDRKAYSIMTNHQDILWLDINDDIETNRKIIFSNSFSKYPVCNGSLDKLVGMVFVKDFLKKYATEDTFELKDIISQPLILPDNIPATAVLEKFIEAKTYTAVIVDEYGAIKGLITLHDIIENIFGELPDRSPDWEASIFEREDGSILIDGSIQIDELKDKLNIEFEGEEHFSTLGGFVMLIINRIPKLGDKFDYKNYTFEVVDMDGKRVDKVLVVKNSITEEGKNEGI